MECSELRPSVSFILFLPLFNPRSPADSPRRYTWSNLGMRGARGQVIGGWEKKSEA